MNSASAEAGSLSGRGRQGVLNRWPEKRKTPLLMALAVWVVQHAANAARQHTLEVATTATGGMHLATFREHSIEKAIDEIGGELHAQYPGELSPQRHRPRRIS